MRTLGMLLALLLLALLAGGSMLAVRWLGTRAIGHEPTVLSAVVDALAVFCGVFGIPVWAGAIGLFGASIERWITRRN